MSLESVFERIAVALETLAQQKSGMTTATYENPPTAKSESKPKVEPKVEAKAKAPETKAKQEEPVGLTYAEVKKNFLNLPNAIVAADGMAAAKARAKTYLNKYAAGADAISEAVLDKACYEEFNAAVLEDIQELEGENG